MYFSNAMILVPIFVLGGFVLEAWAVPTALQGNAPVNSPSLSIPAVASSSTAEAKVQLENLAKIALDVARQNIASPDTRQKRGACTSKNVQVRRDWRAFSSSEKKSFINAVLCLQKKPARTPPELASGAKTRYDDFVATHINQTGQVHYSVHPLHPISILSSLLIPSDVTTGNIPLVAPLLDPSLRPSPAQ